MGTDFVALYAESKGFEIKPRTILVEGTSDVRLFSFAAGLEEVRSGARLLDDDFSIVAAGEKDLGGVSGVMRELIALRQLGLTCLLPSGRPRYRFSALFDNDYAGRETIKMLRFLDSSAIEYRDVFRLHPFMPTPGMLDPTTVASAFLKANIGVAGLDWEIEDLVGVELFDLLKQERASHVRKEETIGGVTHRELSPDGKARLHRLITEYATVNDVERVIECIRGLRCLMNVARK